MDNSAANFADKTAKKKFWSNFAGASDSSAYAHQGTNSIRPQISYT
jgi:hypothetical protein